MECFHQWKKFIMESLTEKFLTLHLFFFLYVENNKRKKYILYNPVIRKNNGWSTGFVVVFCWGFFWGYLPKRDNLTKLVLDHNHTGQHDFSQVFLINVLAPLRNKIYAWLELKVSFWAMSKYSQNMHKQSMKFKIYTIF